MSCPFVSFHLFSCHVLSRYVPSSHVFSSHGTRSPLMLGRFISFVSCQVMSWHDMPRHVTLRHLFSCRLVLCHVMPVFLPSLSRVVRLRSLLASCLGIGTLLSCHLSSLWCQF